MKKLSALLLCLLLAFGLPLASLRAAHAEGEFRTDIYHFNDFEGVVTQEEADRIDDLVYDFIEKYGVDLPVFIASDTGDEDPFDAMERIYYGNQLGYGSDSDGVALLVLTDSDEIYIDGYGERGEDLLELMQDSSAMEAASRKIYDNFAGGDYYEAMKAYVKAAAEAADRLPALEDYSASQGSSSASQGYSENPVGGRPSWWPSSTKSFTEFHDYSAPRLVDDADMFTPAEEKEILQHLQQLTQETGRDLVIFTDTSTHGMSARDYAIAFHRYCGYGFGDDYTGSVLFICMDPDDRQWTTQATGEIEHYYDYDTINKIDDMIFDDMKAGNYKDAMLTYVDSVSYMYQNGELPKPDHRKEIAAGTTGAGIFSGIIAAIGRVFGMKSKMKNINLATDAGRYVSSDLALDYRNDRFLYRSTSRTKIPKNTGGGGGHSGRSSYSSGHSSHGGGRSYSGGGRHF